jgi:hypothetical protein
MVPQLQENLTKTDCVSNIRYLKLAKNRIHYFLFKEYVPLKDSYNISIKFCKLELLDLNDNCLSVLDDESVNMLSNSTALIKLSNNPWSCECLNSSESVYIILGENRTLNCAASEYIKRMSCIGVKHTCYGATSTPKTGISIENEGDENLEEEEEEERENPKLETSSESEPFRPILLIFVIYVIIVLVAIVVVLVITRAVGKPEPDEFWWEDKLAKRSY